MSVISVYQHLPIAYQFFNKGMVHFYPLYGWGTIWCTEMFKGIFFSKIFPQEHADCHRRAQYCKEWNLRGRGAIFGRWIFPGVRNVKKPKDGSWTWWYVTRILYKIYVNMNAICLMLCEDDIYIYIGFYSVHPSWPLGQGLWPSSLAPFFRAGTVQWLGLALGDDFINRRSDIDDILESFSGFMGAC